MSTDVVNRTDTALGDETQLVPPSKRVAKIAFFGIFGIQNLGNECTLQAIVYNARNRLRNGQFCVISFDPGDTLRRHNLAALPMSYQDFVGVRPGRLAKVFRILFRRLPGELLDWTRAVKALRGIDLIVMTGTGMLTDYSTTAFGFPYHVFRWALAARMAGCRVRFVGIGVGPIYQRLSRRFIRWALKVADYRSFRDDFSKKRIESVFDSSHDYVFPDLAFSLPKAIFPAPPERGRRQKQIGLGIMDHRDVHLLTTAQQEAEYSVYLDKMCEFVEWLVAHGYLVRILQGDARHDVAPRAELKARLENRGIRYDQAGIIDEGSGTVEELITQIASVDIVVSPRFHNLLLGLMMNIPAISISYDPKNDCLLDGMGLDDYRQPLTDLNVAKLIHQFSQLDARSDEVKPFIEKKAKEYRVLLEKQYDLIFRELNDNAHPRL